ncbi:MAG: calcium/sodium antiporter [Clostridia bacterium]|nr:calcium/sodium antiporter [Clostridia bacterium]
MINNFLLIMIGMILLVKGADFLVKGSAGIARRFKLSEMIIGLTIVSIGTSLPEVFITIKSAIQGHSDLIIGNAIGSCICNLLLVLGLASLFRPIKLNKRIIKVHIPLGICSMMLLLILGNIHLGEMNVIGRIEGVFLLLCTLVYILYTILEEKREITVEERNKIEKSEKMSVITIVLCMILGVLGLKYGSDLVVDNCVDIAESLKISQIVISMTIIAIGTALPEIVTSIIASIKDEGDIALGNIAGSNILNLCMLIGLGSVINPLKFSIEYNINIVLLMIITLVILMIVKFDKDNMITRRKGILLVLIFLIYIMKLFV